MPHHNRARLADIAFQSLNPDLKYKKTGKNGLFVSNDKSKKTLEEKADVKQEPTKAVMEDISKDQQEEQTLVSLEQTDILELEEVVKELTIPTQEGFLVPNSAQKVADSTSQDSLKENKKKKKKV